MNYILGGRGGKTPIRCDDSVKWGLWFATANRQVGYDRVDDITVGTVFFGMADTYRDGRPVLFETLILGGSNHYPREDYCTWEEAAAGHAYWVMRLSRTCALLEPVPMRRRMPSVRAGETV